MVAERRFDLAEVLVDRGHPDRRRGNWAAAKAVGEQLDVHTHWDFPGTFRERTLREASPSFACGPATRTCGTLSKAGLVCP